MIYHAYTLFDKVIGKYLPATFQNLDVEQFKESTIDAVKHGYIDNASDMELYYLGTFDNLSGAALFCKPQFICYLGEFVKDEQAEN